MKGALAALGFLTCLPVRVGVLGGAELSRALGWFPAVGLGLGGVTALVAAALSTLGQPSLSACLLVALLALLSAGLHLDGLADTFDAAGSRGDASRMLEVMADPRVGAHGAAALCLVLVTKVAACAALPLDEPWPWLLWPFASRALVVPAVCLMPAAREAGLAHAFAEASPRVPLLVALAAAVAVGTLTPARAALPALVAAALAVAAVELWARARLGGATGDVHGAAVELGEVALLVTWALW